MFFLALHSLCGKLIYASESICLKDKMSTSFDEVNGEQGTHKWKLELSEQHFCHFEQHPQEMSNFGIDSTI